MVLIKHCFLLFGGMRKVSIQGAHNEKIVMDVYLTPVNGKPG